MNDELLPLEEIPTRVKAFARLWAMKFSIANPTWRDGEVHEDAFHSYRNYDLNLVCEDGKLMVVAYALQEDEFGNTVMNPSRFVRLIQKGEYK